MDDSIAVRAALARVREAGRSLAGRPRAETLAVLGALLDDLAAPGSVQRAELGAAHSAATGLDPRNVAAGLDLALAGWTGAALRTLVDDETRHAHRLARGFPTTSVLLAGVIPMPSLLSLVLPLALGSPVLSRPGRHDPLTASWLTGELKARDDQLGRALECVHFDREDEAALSAFLAADCVVATGSDEAIREISRRTAPHTRLVRYGHRLSVAAIELHEGDPAWADVARHLARDVCLWDQLGCLSPVVAFVRAPGGSVPDAVERELTAAFGEVASQLPAGALSGEAAAAISHERATAELRCAEDAALHLVVGSDWTLVFETDLIRRPAPLHRFLRLVPVRDADELASAVAPFVPHLAAVGHTVLSQPWRDAILAAGPSRLCPLGQMQAPPIDWPHDGESPLGPLVRWTSHT